MNSKRSKKKHRQLVDSLYAENQGMVLPPEYAYFVKNNLMMFLVRLARYKFVARMIKKTDTVLEVGSGSGMGALFLSQHCRRVMAIEVDEREFRQARAFNCRKNVSFEQKDFFSYQDNTRYDVIVALDVIEHMSLATGKKFLSSTLSHLKPRGQLILGTPSTYSYPYQSKFSKAGHIKLYDQQELSVLVEKYYQRTIAFSMNDELVHTGFHKLAWYYFILGFYPKNI